jgi:uncharacterized lipoprotein YmbA
MNRWCPGALALALLACACSTTQQPRYYTLEPLPAADAVPATRVSVLVEPVAVPAEVDRQQIVRTTQANEVAIEDLHRWASPLQDNVAAVLADDLSARLGTRDVATSPEIRAAWGYRVNVEIREFRSRLGADARLGASWSVRRADGATQTGFSSVREAAAGSDFAALAAAHSRALWRLAGEISDAIRDLERGPGPRP